jgi:hypothetical protein
MPFDSIMVDLETLSTRADGVIMSIGAVKFDLASNKIADQAFYSSVSIDSNYAANMGQRHISESTVMWWMQQSPDAQKVFSEAKDTLMSALEQLREWITEDAEVNADRVLLWSNGASFDEPMLRHAYETKGIDVPWKFYNSRCYRTMKELPIAKTVPKPTPAVAHNALSDALTQAVHLQAIWQAMHAK